ncbi:MAG: hypothetical protein OHK0024_24150 [Thalassobaculales bacterium]
MARRYDLPFRADASTRFLPAIVAAMVFLASLALAGMLASRAAVERWHWNLGGSLTVQILPRAGVGEQALAAQAQAAAEVLVRTAGVAQVRILDPADAAALVAPWLGSAEMGLALPLPTMIDATLAPGARLDAAGLRQRLREVAPTALIDDHGDWLAELQRLARLVDAAGLVVVALVAGTAAAAVAFATRTGLAVHRDTVAVMHLVGAQDGYIAGQFQRHAAGLALRGGIVGVVLAGVAILGLSLLLEAEGPAGLPAEPFGLPPLRWAALLAVPAAAVLVAVVTARLACLSALRRLA